MTRSILGNINRRTLLQGAGMLAAAGLIGVGPARAAEPRKGGHLILGIDNASSADRIDPASYYESYAYYVGRQIFDTLTDLNEDGSLRPALAESWEPRDGARTWVFKLRNGVQFHNGKELTPEDVIYSINHHRGEDSKSAGKGYLLSVSKIEKTGDNEVTFTLSEPNADFSYLLGEVYFGISPDGANFDDGIGTGPFILEDFQPGVRTLTRRNPNYWDSTRGHVDSVETVAYNDSTARVAALISGAVHFINNVEPRIGERIASNPALALHREPDRRIILFVGRSDQGPFQNPDVRLALKYAIDRQQILSSVLLDTGSVAYDNPIFPSNRYFASDLPKRPYDPERALHHWKKAGYDGKVVLSASDGATFAGALDAAQLYQASAEKAGIPFEVERVPADGYWTNTWLKKPFFPSLWAARPTADAMLSLIYLSDAPWNESGWKNPAFDQLVISARAELDEDKRKQLYHDAQQLIVEENSSIIPAYTDLISASTSKLRGFTVIPGQVGPRTAATSWFES
ncbi:ABC transporter substrate-binding protein [Pseudochelatococcus contaminans]|uniref:Peptide/nickel transport system substrate-binding protein n=1 Tax=Pseudochelatococcus contaminans TaxID=1538103 RepID=A0A7W5Z573_9HYPH|nr:ABC transporter substrate-binding protein [Pseudochelatococcus contaminans]MBB3809919.1 peptide/nickel transport system substrate-binding protein [Pseudochelatococcus contaminans]